MKKLSSWSDENRIDEVGCVIPDFTGCAREKSCPSTGSLASSAYEMEDAIEHPLNRETALELMPESTMLRDTPDTTFVESLYGCETDGISERQTGDPFLGATTPADSSLASHLLFHGEKQTSPRPKA